MGSLISIPTDDELELLSIKEGIARQQLPLAIKTIYRLQGWSAKSLSSAVPGISQNVWRQYGQASFTKTRMLHVVAALSWLSQTSMSMFYRYKGSGIKESYLDSPTFECIVYSCSLPSASFEGWMRILLDRNSIKSTNFDHQLKFLRTFKNDEFLAVPPIDINDFKHDYYRSIAVNLHRLRLKYQLSQRDIARVLGVSLSRYMLYENKDEPANIPATLALRLKLGLNMPESFQFVESMVSYKGFNLSRKLQERRKSLVVQVMQKISISQRNDAARFSGHTASYSSRLGLSIDLQTQP